MSITDFGNRSKDEIIEYLIDEHNATERETAQLRQELAEAKETIEEFKRKRSVLAERLLNVYNITIIDIFLSSDTS